MQLYKINQCHGQGGGRTKLIFGQWYSDCETKPTKYIFLTTPHLHLTSGLGLSWLHMQEQTFELKSRGCRCLECQLACVPQEQGEKTKASILSMAVSVCMCVYIYIYVYTHTKISLSHHSKFDLNVGTW